MGIDGDGGRKLTGTYTTDIPLPLLAKTVLRRHQHLRDPQAAHPGEPMATRDVVTAVHRARVGAAAG